MGKKRYWWFLVAAIPVLLALVLYAAPLRLCQLAEDAVNDGRCYDARRILDFLEGIGYDKAADMRTRLVAQEHIEPDYSFYNMKLNCIKEVKVDTTSEEFAALWCHMFLTGTTHMELNTTKDYLPRQYEQIILDRIVAGYEISRGWMPDYASVYDCGVRRRYTDDFILEYTLYLNKNTAYTDEELLQHLETLDTFCCESLRFLNDNLLLGASMSNRQKARVIYEWVGYYLSYDKSCEIHDAGVAVDARLGVCESYVAIYNRMCALAGIPSYGQRGETGDDEHHIWSIQLDESGNVFYTDATWGDKDLKVFGFIDRKGDIYDLFCASYSENKWMRSKYFWQKKLWSTHTPDIGFSYPEFPNNIIKFRRVAKKGKIKEIPSIEVTPRSKT